MKKNGEPEFITHPELPVDVWVAVHDARYGRKGRERAMEREAGRSLIHDIVRIKMGEADFEIRDLDYKKPHGFFNGKQLHITISHSSGLIGGAVSTVRNLGLDLEKTDRNILSGVRERILNPDSEPVTEQLSTLQIWTIKEASLKWLGTGMRLSMKKIRILKNRKALFFVQFPVGITVKICSFQYRKHWFAIAFDDS